MSKPQAFIFFGPSGSGKGTQATRLIEYLKSSDSTRGVLYIETGALARSFVQGEGFANRHAKEILSGGGLFPEFLPIWLWSDKLIKEHTGSEHLVCDGLSRRVPEAPVLDGALRFFGFEHPYIIVINVSREWARERLLERGRGDDAEAAIKKRLDWYEENVVPAVEYFRNAKGFRIIDINGEQTVDAVHAEIVSKVNEA